MENTLQIFNNSEFGKLEVLTIDGKPHFPATECARILGYSNMKDAILRHCRWVVKHDLPHPQSQTKTIEVNFIPEGDLYRLIVRSNLPTAERFERWVFDEVLPSIRQTGAYLTPAAMEQLVNNPDALITALTAYKNEIDAHAETRAAKEQLQLEAEANKPKVLFADAVSASDTTILIGELAKILKGNGIDIGQNRLFRILRDDGFLIKRQGSDYNAPTQKSMELGLFKVKQTAIPHSDGHVTVVKTTKVTGKGQQYFIEKFLSA